MTPEILSIFLEIAIFIIIGILFAKVNVLTLPMKNELSDFLLYLIVPIAIINASQADFDPKLLSGFLICIIFSLVYNLFFIFVSPGILKSFGMDDGKAKACAMMLAFTNSGFIGFPICLSIYGETGLLYAVGYNLSMNFSLFSFGTMLLSGEKFDLKSMSKSLLKNSTFIAAILSFILYLCPFRFPSFLHSSFEMISNMMAPVSLIILGYELAQMKVIELFKDKLSYIISALRLIILPVLVFFILKALRLDPLVVKVMTFVTALPCSAINVILCEKYNCAPKFTAVTTTQSMLLMLITAPLIIYFIESFI